MHNNKEYLTINEILKSKLSTLSTSRLNKICKKLQVKYPNHIIGGGQGKRYKIHSSILDILTRKKKRRISIKVVEDKSKEYIDINMFFNTNWKYFITISPKSLLLPDQLTKLIPKEYYKSLFYGIHSYPDKRKYRDHIHFVLDTDYSIYEIEKVINKIIKGRNKTSVEIYDERKMFSAFDYLKNRNKIISYKEKQNTIDFGFIRGEAPPVSS